MTNSEQQPEPREVRCSACKGLGWILIYDEETDCMDCEGYGSILII